MKTHLKRFALMSTFGAIALNVACGGGGGGWLVGRAGLMAQVLPDGTRGAGYTLSATTDLTAIACRGHDTAFVVGAGGVVVTTTDAGRSWHLGNAGTTATLRDVAASWTAVYAAGDDGLRVSRDNGATWSLLPGATGAWRSVSTDDGGELALALAGDGGVWRWDDVNGTLTELTHVDGGRALALSHDGGVAAVAGDRGALVRSDDGGATWSNVDSLTDRDLHAVDAATDGTIVAVGDGAIVHAAPGDITELAASDLDTVRLDVDGHGYAAGEDGRILRTDDGGATWRQLDVRIPGVLDLDDIDLQ